MSQFEVIKDIGETLKSLLEESFKAAGFTTVNISTDKPKKDNIKNLPTVNCYMYHLGFDQRYRERTQTLVSSYAKDGRVVEYYRDAPILMLAHYIISVWGNSPAEENLLTGLAVKTFLENPILTGEALRGESFFPDDKLNMYPNLQSDYNDVLSFWRSMNEELRPAVYYYVRFRIESDRRSPEVKRVTGKDLAVAGRR
ncbi:MAG: DUF4255 domain-containing protein [Deltaproteobacteria bacterium]|nr:DUF4255 domain-containing protein [Myxococcales bacterium]MCB9728369.1 DUF4255 domain-containing protein [Deltaproteobacteria bacterium]MCB9785923.1 DUF4255 domain-containing protein [Deltaproteobacteria bacterium]